LGAEEIKVGLDISFKMGPALLTLALVILFIIVGLTQKVYSVDGYWVAGRTIGPVENGMAVAGNWMSAASYLGMAGSIGLLGYFGLAYVVGWTCGYLFLLVFMAQQIRKYGKFTAADFIGDRYYSQGARIIVAVTTIIIGFVYAVAQYSGIGLMFGYILGLDYVPGVIFGTVAVLSYVLLAGMLGVTRNQAVQYGILITTFTLPLIAICMRVGYLPFTFFTYGPAVDYVQTEIYRQFVQPFANASLFRWLILCFTMIVGTCGLPHVLTRFYVVVNERIARWSVAWGLFFICLLYWQAPVYSTMGTILNWEINNVYPIPRELADVIVVITAQWAAMPTFVVGAIAAGGVAASFSTTAGLYMTVSAGVAHDIYTRVINPKATDRQQLFIARLVTVILGVLVTFMALDPPALIADLVGMAFAFAGSVVFPVFFLGLWWERTTKEGAIAGMLAGLAITLTAFIMHVAGNEWFMTYIPATSSAYLGTPVNFIVAIVVSKFTTPPPMEVRYLVREVHSPTAYVTRRERKAATASGGGGGAGAS